MLGSYQKKEKQIYRHPQIAWDTFDEQIDSQSSLYGKSRFQISKGVNNERIYPANLVAKHKTPKPTDSELPRGKVWYMAESLPKQKLVPDQVGETVTYFVDRSRDLEKADRAAMKKIVRHIPSLVSNRESLESKPSFARLHHRSASCQSNAYQFKLPLD